MAVVACRHNQLTCATPGCHDAGTVDVPYGTPDVEFELADGRTHTIGGSLTLIEHCARHAELIAEQRAAEVAAPSTKVLGRNLTEWGLDARRRS